MADRPIEELKAGNNFRDGLVPNADHDDHGSPYWHGWALMDAFLAGIDWERERVKNSGQAHRGWTMRKKPKPSYADPFDVWGWPPKLVMDDLSIKSQRSLRRYVERTTKKVYWRCQRTAFMTR